MLNVYNTLQVLSLTMAFQFCKGAVRYCIRPVSSPNVSFSSTRDTGASACDNNVADTQTIFPPMNKRQVQLKCIAKQEAQ